MQTFQNWTLFMKYFLPYNIRKLVHHYNERWADKQIWFYYNYHTCIGFASSPVVTASCRPRQDFGLTIQKTSWCYAFMKSDEDDQNHVANVVHVLCVSEWKVKWYLTMEQQYDMTNSNIAHCLISSSEMSLHCEILILRLSAKMRKWHSSLVSLTNLVKCKVENDLL